VAVHRVTKVLPYTPEQLFRLVSDVDHYPEFVPWIQDMATWNARKESDGVEVVDAEARVGFSFLRERFATRVRRNRDLKTVEVGLISGPFRKLANTWSFTPIDGGTEIGFFIDFEFKSRLLDAMLHANFDRAVNKLIECFEARAKALYGG